MANNDNNSISTNFKRWLKRKWLLWLVLLSTIVLVIVLLWNNIVITIDSGEAAILFRRFSGTDIDTIYGEGVHLFSPLDIVYIYEVRKQVAYHEFDVITNKGLSVHLSLAVRYRPEYELLGFLHQRIGPNYLHRVILPQIESVMRTELGTYTAEDIYTNKAGLLTNAILTALDEVGRNFVEVEDIIIRSIKLPANIVTAIENKLKQEQLMKSYEFRLQTAEREAARREIEAGGIQTYHKIIDESLTDSILRHKGIQATERLATSANAKVVIIGSGKDGLPIILNTDSTPPPPPPAAEQADDAETAPSADTPPLPEVENANAAATPVEAR